MHEHLRANQAFWNEATPHHVASEFYDQEGFKAGRCSLLKLEVEEMGDVQGKSLLHLQCHFGQDTLSWARRGASVVGVDFAPAAVEVANRMAKELDLDARFVQANVYDLPSQLEGRFDRVYTGGGALCWLPDLQGWARVVAHFLKPGGFLYLREFHPFARVFDDESKHQEVPRYKYPYFNSGEAEVWTEPGTYAAPDANLQNATTFEWSHGLGSIVNALIGAGLEIRSLNEFGHTQFQQLPCLTRGEDGVYRLPEGISLPLMFSIRASKR